MRHECLIECLSQVLGAASYRDISIGWMMFEEVCFGLEGFRHWLVCLNILLRSIDHTDEAKLEGINSAREDVQRICAMVHQIQLCLDTNCPSSHRINMARKFESFGIDDVDVRRRHSKDYRIGFRDVFGDKGPCLLLNV